jgi:pectate lyase
MGKKSIKSFKGMRVKTSLSLLVSILILTAAARHTAAQIPAFPGAEGFGSQTPGGRGGKVMVVSNLKNGGPGSLREALEAEGKRIVVFTTGGIIDLETPIKLTNPFVTIAGQTAPGGGICIRGNGIDILTHDVIMRYLRVRPGDINFGPENNWGSLDAISIGNSKANDVYNIVIDHCSLSWGVDENLGIWGGAHDITIQNCIISEGLNSDKHPKGPHSKGLLIGGGSTNISVHHNLFAHNNERNPLLSEEGFIDFRNNVVYNAGGQISGIVSFGKEPAYQRMNYVNNYIKPGKNRLENWELTIRHKSKEVAEVFISGNVGPNNANPIADNWYMVRFGDSKKLLPEKQRAEVPFAHPPVTTHSSLDALDIVLSQAGAILPSRDPVDRKVVSDTQNSDGRIVFHKDGMLEWPPLEKGIPFLDSDGDGMPDHWEERFDFDPNDAAGSSADTDGDGYTNIEEYINRTNPLSANNQLNESVQTLSQDYLQLDFELQQNFPNPFTDTTQIKFVIAKSSSAVLRIVDLQGKVIKEIAEGFLYEGKYEVTIDTQTLEPGMYFLMLQAGKHLEKIKLVRDR